MDKTRHFLIVFDGTTSTMKEGVRTFEDVAAALEAYAQAERAHEQDRSVQVVLIASDSLETVKDTHPNFWRSTDFRELTEVLQS